MMLRSLACLRAPALAMAAQMLPVAPEDIVLMGFAVQVWVRDVRNLAGRSRQAWRSGAVMLAATSVLQIIAEPQRLVAGLALADQIEPGASWDHEPLTANALQEG